jgi:uncharacterized protein (TIGR00297 family)
LTTDFQHLVLSLTLGGLVALLGWKRQALSAGGAAAATVVGAATVGFGGLPAALALIALFVTGSALSRRRAAPGEVEAAKGHRRDAIQVLANGGVGALAVAAAAAGWRPGRAAALGALACAAADTWASEIGVRSPTPPRSIVSGLVVPAGTSGGVTPLGWAAAGAGALVVGAAWTVAGDRRAAWLWLALVGGLAGSCVDSVAGATIQASYRCELCGSPAEAPGAHCGRPRRLSRGRAWVTNDVVNGIGTAAGAVVGAALAWLIRPRAG